jgi:hypothetical protein
MPFARWNKVNDSTFQVYLGDGLQRTFHGLGLALRRIPMVERNEYARFQWGTEFVRDGKRWSHIKAYK